MEQWDDDPGGFLAAEIMRGKQRNQEEQQELRVTSISGG